MAVFALFLLFAYFRMVMNAMAVLGYFWLPLTPRNRASFYDVVGIYIFCCFRVFLSNFGYIPDDPKGLLRVKKKKPLNVYMLQQI